MEKLLHSSIYVTPFTKGQYGALLFGTSFMLMLRMRLMTRGSSRVCSPMICMFSKGIPSIYQTIVLQNSSKNVKGTYIVGATRIRSHLIQLRRVPAQSARAPLTPSQFCHRWWLPSSAKTSGHLSYEFIQRELHDYMYTIKYIREESYFRQIGGEFLWAGNNSSQFFC